MKSAIWLFRDDECPKARSKKRRRSTTTTPTAAWKIISKVFFLHA
jgi:hypothetical protein